MAGIIVGVDGSEHSRRALAWAMREAAHHQVPLMVMTIHPEPVRPATNIYWPVPEYSQNDSDLKLAQMAVRELVDKTDIGQAAPAITVNVFRGDAAAELVRASKEADMIVVGTRGSGGFSRLVMGSVSTKVTHHAACPVVVVP